MRPFIFLMLATLMACGPSAQPAAQSVEEVRAERQVLRIGMGFGPNGMGAASALTPIPFVHWPVYDNITQFGKNFEVLPSIAERWSVGADGRTWTFTLRRDMLWPDGKPLTAEDVVYTFGKMREERWFNSGNIANIATATVVDPSSFQFATRTADTTIPYVMPYFWVVPKHYYEQVGRQGFSAKPMGSGPYELVEFRNDDLVHLRKRAAEHPFRSAVAQEIQFRIIPEAGQRLTGLRGGELDLLAQTNLTPEQFEQLSQAGATFNANLTSINFIAMPSGTATANNTPLQDKRVRLALNYAVDKDAVLRTIYRNSGAEALGQIALPSSLYFDPDTKPYPYDLAQARRLLAEAGYGSGFRLKLATSAGQNVKDLILAVQSNLRDVGVTVEVVDLEGGAFSDRALGVKNELKEDLWFQISGDTTGFGNSARTLYGCGKPANAAATALFWCNPRWDELMDQALAEPDREKRIQILRQANRIQREDVPTIPLLASALFVVSGPKARGVTILSPLHYNFDSVYLVR